MTNTLSHRGPDACGSYISPDGSCALGHARLSIIDIADGCQPMCNEDGTIWLSYNGECYNFQELKADLARAGHIFKTNCDSEVAIHLYEQYGMKFLDHMQGMFALAIWDQNKKELFIARDRMGQKPLFFYKDNNCFLFASEPKAILANTPKAAVMDNDAIAEYLVYGYIGSNKSGFKHIEKLNPGSYTTITCDGKTSRQSQYWQLPDERSFTGSYQDAVELVRETVTSAVKKRMISDVPLGSFLSGGIDSTIITGIMAQASSSPVKTCGIGFNEQKYNELSFSRMAAVAFGCDHIEHIVDSNCIETLSALINYYDEPFADCSALPTWHLCRLTRKRVTVALSGDGGDECYGGYKRHKAINTAAMINKNYILRKIAQSGLWSKITSGEHHSKIHYLKRFLSSAALPPWQCYLNWLGVFPLETISDIIKCKTDNNYLESARAIFSDRSPCEAAIAFDGMHYLPANLNTKTDRASMAHSLEVRSPFQDHKVSELAYSLPVKWLTDCPNGKKILKDAFKDILPPEIRTRSKMGFGVPVGRWFRNELRPLYGDCVLNGSLAQTGFINSKHAEKLMIENDRQINDYGQHMWTLLTLQMWHDKWVTKS